MTSEPTILLKHAELLHVALSTVAHVIGSRTNYPTENIESVIGAYRVSRDKHLTDLGFTKKQISAFTDAAAEALTQWLDERQQQRVATDEDFEQWAKELMGE